MRTLRYLIYYPPLAQAFLAVLVFADVGLDIGSTEWLAANGIYPQTVGTIMLIAAVLMFVWVRYMRVNHIGIIPKILVAWVFSTPMLLRMFATVWYLWFVSATGSDFTWGVFLIAYISMAIFYYVGLVTGEKDDAAVDNPPTDYR